MSTLDDIAAEARARIMWGDPPDEVRNWLQGKGYYHTKIDAFLSHNITGTQSHT